MTADASRVVTATSLLVCVQEAPVLLPNDETHPFDTLSGQFEGPMHHRVCTRVATRRRG
jgi:hypothetical protein